MDKPVLHHAIDIPRLAWERLRRAADDPADLVRLVTLATVTPEGLPAARLMVLRGADRTTGRIWFHTRAKSAKTVDIAALPACCVVVYDPAEMVQLRLVGRGSLHTLDDLARGHFEHGALARERMMEVVAAPLPDLLWPGSAEELRHAVKRQAWQHFTVVEMVVESIEWLQALPDARRRAVLRAEEGWRAEELPD
ncbi:MAG: pyridoxamine 5'-phosphate oxidase family protein [Phycisphaerales bacterium]|nr:pyridoxamine 5'-phosphate oxidase family protein [Phycisphaerales bacterium]